jgi:penicillin-binding protein 1A
MEDASDSPSLKLRLRRDVGGVWGGLNQIWAVKWARWAVYAIGGILILWALMWAVFARDLPSVDRLKSYEPPLPTNVRGNDGTPIHSYARERRVELSYRDYPPMLINSYLAAEDRTFFTHGGIDYIGILSAVFSNITNGKRPRGASTITQQVVKNLLLTNEVSYVRKVKEAILAKRLESALTKQQILELYLNQIFLGRNAYGVQAAARAYFNKDVAELELQEMAFLAILPKSPINYSPERHAERAMERRNWVLKEMRKNNFINDTQYATAVAMPLGTLSRTANTQNFAEGYFTEEVRRSLIEKFGENSDNGRNPFSVYGGGLWVRTSLDPVMQGHAQDALRAGLIRYDAGKGWSGPIKTLEAGENWRQNLASANLGIDYADWKVAMVLDRLGGALRIGFSDGATGLMPAWGATQPRHGTGTPAFNMLKPGDVIVAKAEGSAWVLRNIPEVSGGMMVEDPHTGRVLAMQGGFDSRLATFNRATQALRQPGSSFKPFVYASALTQGMTPASIIVDGPFCVYQSAKLGQKCFRNFGGGGGSGPHTMRWGVEQSRNLMTVRAASQTGMDHVVKLADAVGISAPGHPFPAVLAVALGAGDTTVQNMVNGYSILVSNGQQRKPSLIDFAQDRRGKVIFRADDRCKAMGGACNAADWNGGAMPRPPSKAKQVMDAMSAYQMVHIMEGVIQRGTAVLLKDMGRPLFGKTGTTTGPTNVWFVGGSADLVAGVYMGFDQPRPMGGYAQGGTLAVPIFKAFAKKAMENMPVVPFRAPTGVRMVRIDRGSGQRVFGAWPGTDPESSVIWEAFKPESEPRRTVRRDELPKPGAKVATTATTSTTRKVQTQTQHRDSDFLQRQGGIY